MPFSGALQFLIASAWCNTGNGRFSAHVFLSSGVVGGEVCRNEKRQKSEEFGRFFMDSAKKWRFSSGIHGRSAGLSPLPEP